MANLIPMAGLGTRFSNKGFTLPKPLIPVSGQPMIIKAIRDMPSADKWIFVVRREHITEFHIDKIIKSEIPHAIVVPVDETTEGQACTCMLAKKFLSEDEPLFIAACDNGFLYNKEKYEQLRNTPDVDCIVWTFTQKETLRRTPTAWGWCKLAPDGTTIEDMSVKIPVSDNPYNDHAVVASFYFKKARYFFDAINLMVNEDYRINNEFYVDAVPIFLNKLNKKSVIFDVDLYIGWGTPEDLYDYQLMEFTSKTLPEIETDLLWRKYFEKNET